MSESTAAHPNTPNSDITYQDTALTRALSRLMAPIARLCLANGVTFAAAEEVLKQAFVQEAHSLQPGVSAHGTVSRISTATGLTRREVDRLIKTETRVRPTKPPIATELFARWISETAWRDENGSPLILKRLGSTPSFESLAQSITRDVHPRSILDELVRLGIAHHDEKLDCVSLKRKDFVPGNDIQQMFNMLGDNVGDHLDAAVGNVMHDGNQHLEQAVFADELSAESIKLLQPILSSRWKALRDTLVPVISACIESDRASGRIQNQRMRVGLYTFAESVPVADPSPEEQKESPDRKTGTRRKLK